MYPVTCRKTPVPFLFFLSETGIFRKIRIVEHVFLVCKLFEFGSLEQVAFQPPSGFAPVRPGKKDQELLFSLHRVRPRRPVIVVPFTRGNGQREKQEREYHRQDSHASFFQFLYGFRRRAELK
ncbi:hypothetical protein SDC9_195712 [bioreactor metagenome]|uniref:Uncharacterized protein n=1 Tax=bioreactor metagenome TaxID=1076179 RepID=A0A645IA31_9ZZZZ